MDESAIYQRKWTRVVLFGLTKADPGRFYQRKRTSIGGPGKTKTGFTSGNGPGLFDPGRNRGRVESGRRVFRPDSGTGVRRPELEVDLEKGKGQNCECVEI